MFGFSKKDKKPTCPIPDERRQWLEHAFGWLVGTFGEDPIRQRRVLTPHHSDFPIRYNSDPKTGRDTIDIIARQMEIAPAEIELLFYEEGTREISTGDFGHSIFTAGEKKGEGVKSASGRYMGRQDDGKFHIALEQKSSWSRSLWSQRLPTSCHTSNY